MDSEEVYWNNFMVLFIDRMVRSMRNDINEKIADLEISGPQAPYVLSLYIKDYQSMASLSNFLEMDRANTSRVIRSLESKGLVVSERRTGSSRNVPIMLTSYGRKVAEKLFERVVDINKSFFEGIPEMDVVRFKNTVIRVFRNIYGIGGGADSESFYKDLGVESVPSPRSLTTGRSSTRKLGNL